MPDQEYDDLVNERDRLEDQAAAARQRMARYRDRADRLKPVYRQVYSLKHDAFGSVIRNDKNTVKDQYEWTGRRYQDFVSDGDELCSINENYRDYSLDKVLDALNNEITRYENLYLEEHGLLGRLTAKLNGLINQIENWVN